MSQPPVPMKKPQEKHSLQRLSSPSRGFSAFVHFLGLSSFAASFQYLVANPTHLNDSYGWHFQYLTIIGLLLATVTFTLGSASDITTSATLFRLKNVLSITSAPLEVLISTLYWSLRAVDPTLVVPADLELPLLPDLGFHAIPSLLLVIDLLLLSPPWTITVVPATIVSATIAFTYWFWIEVCFARNGFYPYPLFSLLETWQRVVVFGVSAGLMVICTVGLKWVYGVVNGVTMDGSGSRGLETARTRGGDEKRALEKS